VTPFEPGPAALLPDTLERAVHVLGGLRVKGDIVAAGRPELGDDPVDRLDHPMDVNGGIDPIAPQRPAHGGTEG
jgi:hypothetical protein